MERDETQQPGPAEAEGEAPPGPSVDEADSVILWLVGVFYILLAGASALVMALVPALREAGFISLIIATGLLPVALGAWWKRPSTQPQVGESRKLDRMAVAIEEMVQEGGLSEGAKRVLHRRTERDLLRRAIEQDIRDEDWQAAMVLIRELAERFGYRADAEEFRARVERARAESLDRHVEGAIQKFEALLEQRRWTDAYAEAARIQQLYPDSPRVDGLRERVDEARHRFKRDLERRFLHAAQRDEVDRAMDLLKEMDAYLTEEEAEPLREVARGVIGKARENLGARFKLLVEDREWVEAARVGDRIIKEFPNTRMAQEVHSMMDFLRERAGHSQSVGRA